MGDTKAACGREGLNWNFEIVLGLQQEAVGRKGGYSRRRTEHEQRHRGWKMLGAVIIISGYYLWCSRIRLWERQRLIQLERG